MQRLAKAGLSFKKKSASSKTAFGKNVITCLTPAASASKKEASAFPDLPVPVSELTDLNTTLVNCVSAKLDGGRAASQALKNAVVAWDTGFTLTANYITLMAGGDAATIIGAGFIPTKSQTQPAAKPAALTAFNATINGSKGAIIAGTKKAVPDAKAFICTAVPAEATVSYVNDMVIITIGESNIYLTAGTNRETELYNLPSGVPVNVSMYAINSAGSGPATTAKQVIPQ